MDWPRLDTSSWNLSLGAIATSMLAACGPFVILEGETDSDTNAETDPDPPGPSEPGPTDTTPSVECYNASDCEPGYDCIDNVCMPYDYYCGTGGCCDDDCCYEECCYGECYNGCYSDEECGPQALCESDYGYNECVYPYELPECDTPEVLVLGLPQVGDGDIVSLSFVAANGDTASDLVVGRGGNAELHWGADVAPPDLLPVPGGQSVIDAVAGDFDGDGDQDIVVSTLEGSLMVLAGDGTGNFVFVQESSFGEALYDLAALHWNGDGALDVACRTSNGGALLLLNDGMGGLGNGVSLPAGAVYSLALTDFGGDDYDDLVVQDESSAEVFLGDFSGDLTPDVYLSGVAHGLRQVLSGPIDAFEPDEVIGYSRQDTWLLLELWANGGGTPQRYALFGEDGLAATGDYDGDGVTDVLTYGGSVVGYVHGSAENGYPTFTCRGTYFIGMPAYSLAVGDFDGNGRADVALDGGATSVSVLLSF